MDQHPRLALAYACPRCDAKGEHLPPPPSLPGVYQRCSLCGGSGLVSREVSMRHRGVET